MKVKEAIEHLKKLNAPEMELWFTDEQEEDYWRIDYIDFEPSVDMHVWVVSTTGKNKGLK